MNFESMIMDCVEIPRPVPRPQIYGGRTDEEEEHKIIKKLAFSHFLTKTQN